ncbi:MAG TPA: nucleoside 2-deoxyribosyltransferase [Pyrinomonadaceae bacterium]|jgi:nucleoside 2-deoxyribosyltransferase
MRIYISGAFCGSKNWEAARARYEHLGVLLREQGFSVYLPHNHTDPIQSAELSSRAVFEQDMEEIYKSNTLLALLDEPSHGVGAEVALALKAGMPVFGACSRSQTVSRFIQGLLEVSETGEFFEYDNLDEVVEKVIETMSAKRVALYESA